MTTNGGSSLVGHDSHAILNAEIERKRELHEVLEVLGHPLPGSPWTSRSLLAWPNRSQPGASYHRTGARNLRPNDATIRDSQAIFEAEAAQARRELDHLPG